MSKDTERASPPLHIHFGDRMLDAAARDIVDVVKRVERGEPVPPQRHLSFEGWDTLAHALRVAGLSGQTSAAVIAALKGIAGEDEFSCEAPDDSASPAPWGRSALANLRRKWLHYHALGERTIAGQHVADDLAPIVPAFEVACDEVDQLRQRVAGLPAPASFTEWRGQTDADTYDGRLLDEAAAAAGRGEREYVIVEQAEADIAQLRGGLRRTLRDGSGASTGEIDREDSYKGYAPDIRINPTTGTLHAVASGISDVVHAEGRTAADLWQAFRDSVDEYLAACAEKGCEPQQPQHHYTLDELLAGITPDNRPDLAGWRENVGWGPLVMSNNGQHEQGWELQLTDLDMAGIADALTRSTGADCPAQEIEVLALAPALSQGYGVDKYIAAIRHRARVMVVAGAEIGWSIVPPEELDAAVTQLEQALVLSRQVKEHLA
ncbi:hypothetical protein [Azospirillum argentinense]